MVISSVGCLFRCFGYSIPSGSGIHIFIYYYMNCKDSIVSAGYIEFVLLLFIFGPLRVV